MLSFSAFRSILFLSGLIFLAPAMAIDYGSFAKINQAVSLISKVNDISDTYKAATSSVTDYIEVKEPSNHSDGKFILPFTSDGNLAAWAEKALTAQASAAAAGVASDKAVDALASKVPFGSAFSGSLKKKGKNAAAVAAIGGWDYIKENSNLSVDKLTDYAVYLHKNFSGHERYKDALAASLALYPKLEKKYVPAVKKAFKAAAKQAKAAGAE